MDPPSRRNPIGLLWLLAWISTTAVGLYLSPAVGGHGTHQQLGLPPCPSAMVLDRPCPGCGLTTSWSAFLHGDWALAFRSHPLGPALYVCFSLYALASGYRWLRFQGGAPDSPVINRAAIVVAVVFLGFGALRMAREDRYSTGTERWLGTLINRESEERGQTARVPEKHPTTDLASSR